MLVGVLMFPYSGFGGSQKDQSAGKQSQESSSKKLDQNAELGKGHLGPQDPATKQGASEAEHRASGSGHGQNDPLTGSGKSSKQSGNSGKSSQSDFGGQGASDQGSR
jgi:hypothetical protein